MDNKPLEKKLITIMSVEPKTFNNPDGSKFTVMKLQDENGNKYSFYTTKKDGTETKAWQQFKEQQMSIGKSVGVAFNAEPKEFTNAEGKNIKYTKRSVMFFANPDQMEEFNVVQAETPAQQAQAEIPTDEDLSNIPF